MHYFLSLLLLISWQVKAAPVSVPALTSPVMDLGGFLSANERQDLSELAYEIYANKGPQITVLTVPDLQDYPIEEFSIRVAEKWKLGMKGQGNGLLIIIARAERKVRIEVGEGIEGEITDFEANQYINQVLAPSFKRGDFHGGLRAVMENVAKKFSIEPKEGKKLVRRVPPPRQLGAFEHALPFLFLVLVIGHLLLRRRRVARGIFSGAGMAGVGLFMIPGIGLGVLVLFILGLVFGLAGISNILYALASSRGGRYGGGGFGGGGGWSGGGGGFSGGGSSGSW